MGDRSTPHRDLASWIRAQAGKLTYLHGQDTVALISHCVMDLYLSTRFPKLHLLERYTGSVKTERDFGTKLIPSGAVPFNLYTHRLFGDKIHLKPMIKGSMRDSVLKSAEKKNWTKLGQDAILAEITKLTEIPADQLVNVRL